MAYILIGPKPMHFANLTNLSRNLLVPDDRRMVLWGLLLCTVCVAYFYLLDQWVLSSAGFTPIFRLLLTSYDAQTAWLALAACFLAALWRKPAPIMRVVDFLARHPAAVAGGGVIMIALGTLFIYHDFPLSMDEYAAVFQSKVFAAGRLAALLPPAEVDWLIWPRFNGSFLFASRITGAAIEGYWPGFAALLAPFELLRAPWLCNALLAGLAILLVFGITLKITGDRRAAGWAVLFALASGAFLANAISYYSMHAHLTLNLLYARLLLEPTRGRALGAGLVGSLALVLHNPFPHALFAAPWILALAADPRQRRLLAPLLIAYLPLAIGVGLGWLALRTSIIPAEPSVSGVTGIGRGVFGFPHAALLNVRAASFAKLWIWCPPCLLMVAVLGRARHGADRRVRLLMQSAVLTFVGYLFVSLDQGHGWGYRYFHSAWGVIPILAGCAMTGRSDADSRLVSFAGAAAVLNLLIVVPFQLSQIDGIITRHLALLPEAVRPGNNVYFIRPRGLFYVEDMNQIDPWLRSQDLLLTTRGRSLDAELIRRNWPNAVLVSGGPWGAQWYLGPTEQRRGAPGEARDKRFVFAPGPFSQSQ